MVKDEGKYNKRAKGTPEGVRRPYLSSTTARLQIIESYLLTLTYRKQFHDIFGVFGS